MRRIGIMLGVVLYLTIAFTANASTDDSAEPTPKSKRTARMLSLGSTLLPITLGIALIGSGSESTVELGVFLIGGGVILGPGVGQAYADRPVRFAAGAIVRTLCLGVATSAAIIGSSGHNDPSPTGGTQTVSDGTKYAVIVGLGGYLFSAVYDIATAGRSVDAYNRKHFAPELSVGNFYQPRDKTLGVALTLRF